MNESSIVLAFLGFDIMTISFKKFVMLVVSSLSLISFVHPPTNVFIANRLHLLETTMSTLDLRRMLML